MECTVKIALRVYYSPRGLSSREVRGISEVSCEFSLLSELLSVRQWDAHIHLPA